MLLARVSCFVYIELYTKSNIKSSRGQSLPKVIEIPLHYMNDNILTGADHLLNKGTSHPNHPDPIKSQVSVLLRPPLGVIPAIHIFAGRASFAVDSEMQEPPPPP